jgi:hypothetical protein
LFYISSERRIEQPVILSFLPSIVKPESGNDAKIGFDKLVYKCDNFIRQSETSVLLFSSKTTGKEKSGFSQFSVLAVELTGKNSVCTKTVFNSLIPIETKPPGFRPYNEYTDNKWFNLVEKSKNSWVFANYINEKGYMIFDLNYSPLEGRMTVSHPIRSEIELSGDFISRIDDSGQFFVMQSGEFYRIDGKIPTDNQDVFPFSKANNKENREKSFDVIGQNACYLDQNNMIYQKWCSNTNETVLTKVTLLKKHIGKDISFFRRITDKAKGKNAEPNSRAITIKTGQTISVRPYYHFTPMAASPDRKKVAFVANYSDKALKTGSKLHSPSSGSNGKRKLFLWLVVWDTEKNTISKITPLPPDYSIPAMPFTMLWCPAARSPLISYNSGEGVYIIDISKSRIKKILFPHEPNFRVYGEEMQVIHWSPDGHKLGLLKTNGAFYIYDIFGDTLTQVNNDKDCFNFVWVK